MKNSIKILALLLSPILFWTCGDEQFAVEETGHLTLNFKVKYGEDYVTFDKAFLHTLQLSETEAQETPIKFINLAHFVGDIIISDVDKPTPEVELEDDVKYLDFSSIMHDEALAAQGISLTYENLPVGEYENIKFSIGVEEELNAEKPTDYAPSHPLSYPERYWAVWESFIFAKIEGQMDTNDDNEVLCDVPFTYHIGMDTYYMNIKPLLHTFEIKADAHTEINIVLDYQNLLERGKIIDVRTETITHSNPENDAHISITEKISENFITAFSIE